MCGSNCEGSRKSCELDLSVRDHDSYIAGACRALWAKEMECEIIRLNLAKEKELRAKEELRTEGLR